MTRASLLHILDHVGRISEAEVRELEQLATTFPYCQTAHVLLAKAAHDRGSMLASQRLRRAATYAADRQLLRQLLEQPIQEPATLLTDAASNMVEAPQTRQAALPAGTATAFFQTLGPEDVQAMEVADGTDESGPFSPEASTEEPVTQNNLPELPTPILAEDETTGEEIGAQHPERTSGADETAPQPAAVAATDATAEALPTETAESTLLTLPAEPGTAALATTESEVAAEGLPQTPDATPVADVVSEAGQPVVAEEAPEVESQPAEPEELLPAAAPPIRPPVEAGISRFEFGLGGPDTPAISALYQLPGVQEADEAETLPVSQEAFPPFRSDAELAYALLGGGSRFGYALQMQDGELTSGLPADEFFAPDALLHAYGVAHRPKAAPGPSSLDLINRFLKNQPRLKSPAVRLSLAEEQTDLSVRSTSVAPQLASESLAKIMVRQGKIDKAIEIYERLMMRQPEKSAYFADQIQQLQTPE